MQEGYRRWKERGGGVGKSGKQARRKLKQEKKEKRM